MLKGLQLVGICMSMVNPTNFYYENKKQANTQYDYNVGQENTASNTRQQTIGGELMSQESYKMYANRLYETFNINIETISQTIFQYGTDNDLGYVTINVDNEKGNTYTPTLLTMIQLTPYKNLVNNRVTLNQTVNVKTISQAQGQITLQLKTDTYVSTDERWMNYMNQTSWNTWNKNLEIISDVENSQNGFTYTSLERHSLLSISDTSTPIDINHQFTIPVDPNKANFIFMLSYLENVQQGQETGVILKPASYGPVAILPYASSLVRIQGEFINANINYEVINLPGLMFDVLTMPFTFISMAFNLTLFPYTPYQINISNLFLSIIGCLVFIMIIKKILGR